MLDPASRQRLFGYEQAFEHPVTCWITIGLAVLLSLSFVICLILGRTGKISPESGRELLARNKTWALLIPLMLLPILAGALWTMLGVLVLSLLCYREYARATGLFREFITSAVVVVGIGFITYAVIDNWYGFFTALSALGTVCIAAITVLTDRPKGYIQRSALGIFAFMFFGFGLGHLGFMANAPDYRPILLLILFAVEFNDIAAFIWGKLLGRRKLAPRTSPGKSIAGFIGALVSTTVLVTWLGAFAFAGSEMDHGWKLVGLGVIISLAGQLGDLVMSSIKRDLGVKDIGKSLPGHGGILDRFDSLLLVAPAVFHYVGYWKGFGVDQPVRILSGG
ncbi:MAG: phosphatidate cytidylyltransferase [Verrucomicrobiota bacterium]|jgi:phosphatidate cytidylyltransferase